MKREISVRVSESVVRVSKRWSGLVKICFVVGFVFGFFVMFCFVC